MKERGEGSLRRRPYNEVKVGEKNRASELISAY